MLNRCNISRNGYGSIRRIRAICIAQILSILLTVELGVDPPLFESLEVLELEVTGSVLVVVSLPVVLEPPSVELESYLH